MSQQEVLEVLKERKIATTDMIARDINISRPAAWNNLHRLLEEEEVERIPMTKQDMIEYGMSSRGKTHYLWKLKIVIKRR